MRAYCGVVVFTQIDTIVRFCTVGWLPGAGSNVELSSPDVNDQEIGEDDGPSSELVCVPVHRFLEFFLIRELQVNDADLVVVVVR